MYESLSEMAAFFSSQSIIWKMINSILTAEIKFFSHGNQRSLFSRFEVNDNSYRLSAVQI